MEWFQERYNRYLRASEEHTLILRHAEAMYEAFWDEIKAVVAVGRASGLYLSMNGVPRSRTVLMGRDRVPDANGLPDRKLQLVLAGDRRSIVASFDARAIVIEVGVCADGVLCLKYEGRQRTLEETVRLVMEPSSLKDSRRWSFHSRESVHNTPQERGNYHDSRTSRSAHSPADRIGRG